VVFFLGARNSQTPALAHGTVLYHTRVAGSWFSLEPAAEMQAILAKAALGHTRPEQQTLQIVEQRRLEDGRGELQRGLHGGLAADEVRDGL